MNFSGRLSLEKKWLILNQSSSGKSVNEISDGLLVVRRSIGRVLDEYEESGKFSHSSGYSNSKFPQAVKNFIRNAVLSNPTLFLFEIVNLVHQAFPHISISKSTVRRILHKECGFTNKKLSTINRLVTVSEKLLCFDEFAKDFHDVKRKRAWGEQGKEATKLGKLDRGIRISCLASCNIDGFQSAVMTRGTFCRSTFYSAFCESILPLIEPFPGKKFFDFV